MGVLRRQGKLKRSKQPASEFLLMTHSDLTPRMYGIRCHDSVQYNRALENSMIFLISKILFTHRQGQKRKITFVYNVPQSFRLSSIEVYLNNRAKNEIICLHSDFRCLFCVSSSFSKW